MRSYITIVAALYAAVASASSTANAFNNPAGGYSFTVGEPTTLSWHADSGSTVTLRLQYGTVSTANSGTIIASNIPNDGSYTWNVPSDLASEPDYTIEIVDDQDTSNYNFSPRFTVSGATVATTTSASSVTISTTTISTTSTRTSTKTTTPSSSTSTPTTLTTSSSSSASSSSAVSTTSTSASTSTSSTVASSTTSAASVPTTNAGMANRVSGGLLAVVAGVAMML
ncbi:cell wall protein [Penicillium daleae]|uniref:Cell wall protein n=1 Tax=Penicillium daleae TaxID=63821 RepID=A0AAD6G1U8_9EURO|nr:cell wall protein [Penicillium daleae]KAJ5449769.1 cell wall protein [Penicillium daleae]